MLAQTRPPLYAVQRERLATFWIAVYIEKQLERW